MLRSRRRPSLPRSAPATRPTGRAVPRRCSSAKGWRCPRAVKPAGAPPDAVDARCDSRRLHRCAADRERHRAARGASPQAPDQIGLNGSGLRFASRSQLFHQAVPQSPRRPGRRRPASQRALQTGRVHRLPHRAEQGAPGRAVRCRCRRPARPERAASLRRRSRSSGGSVNTLSSRGRRGAESAVREVVGEEPAVEQLQLVEEDPREPAVEPLPVARGRRRRASAQ